MYLKKSPSRLCSCGGEMPAVLCEDCTMVFLTAHTLFNVDECKGKELEN